MASPSLALPGFALPPFLAFPPFFALAGLAVLPLRLVFLLGPDLGQSLGGRLPGPVGVFEAADRGRLDDLHVAHGDRAEEGPGLEHVRFLAGVAQLQPVGHALFEAWLAVREDELGNDDAGRLGAAPVDALMGRRGGVRGHLLQRQLADAAGPGSQQHQAAGRAQQGAPRNAAEKKVRPKPHALVVSARQAVRSPATAPNHTFSNDFFQQQAAPAKPP